jgi:hypothetical protein
MQPSITSPGYVGSSMKGVVGLEWSHAAQIGIGPCQIDAMEVCAVHAAHSVCQAALCVHLIVVIAEGVTGGRGRTRERFKRPRVL